MAKIGRNDPCPCGSGRKYKQCHLGKDEEADAMPAEKTLADRLDRELVESLRIFANKRFGKDWFREAADLFDIADESELALMVPWSYFHFRVEDADTIADVFRREKGDRLSAEEREWLDSQQAAWLSIWKVVEVTPGKQIDLEDVLTGERRSVHERKASQSLVRHDAVLCRITDFRGVSTLSGLFPRAMPPRSATTLVDEVRKVLRKAKIDISVSTLRKEPATLALVRLYQELLDAMDNQPRPQLSNTDGDSLLLTKDRFRFAATDRKAVEAALLGIEGTSDDDGTVVFTRPGNKMQKSWQNTIVATATIKGGILMVETNSIQRADAVRRQLETACKGMLEHLSRDHSDPEALLETGSVPPRKERSPEEAAEMNRIARELRDRMNREWLDEEVPALGGKTPREAARSPKLRKELVLLLTESEHREERMPPEQRVDVSWMWAELGLAKPSAPQRGRQTQ